MREQELAGRAFRLTNPGFDVRTQLVQATMERLGGSVQNGRRQRVESAKVRLQWESGRFGNVLATLGHNSLLPFRGGCAPGPPRASMSCNWLAMFNVMMARFVDGPTYEHCMCPPGAQERRGQASLRARDCSRVYPRRARREAARAPRNAAERLLPSCKKRRFLAGSSVAVLHVPQRSR